MNKMEREAKFKVPQVGCEQLAHVAFASAELAAIAVGATGALPAACEAEPHVQSHVMKCNTPRNKTGGGAVTRLDQGPR